MSTESFRTPYADYDVLAKWDSPSWDAQTREAIRKRLTEIPPRRFFTEGEWHTLEAVCARLVPQPERPAPIPIVPWIDEKLHRNWGDGFRYADMPPLRDAWRFGIAGIDHESRARFGAASRRSPKPARTRCFEPFRPARSMTAAGRAFRRGAFSRQSC